MFNPVHSTRYHRAIRALTLPITLFFLSIGINFEPQISRQIGDYKEHFSHWDKITTIHKVFVPHHAKAELLTSTIHCPEQENNRETSDSTLVCIWGYIYYQGRPIEGAKVVIKLGHEEIQTMTQTYDPDLEPYYWAYLPAPAEEMLHITASFAKQRVAQSFQHINTKSTLDNGFSLGIASKGRWKLWYFNLKGVNRLISTEDEKILLAGSSEGLTQMTYNMPSHRALSEQNYSLFDEDEIRDLNLDIWGNVWIVTKSGIAIWQESSWLFMDDPVLDGIEWDALISHPDTGDLWFGGKRNNSTQGEVVFYDASTESWSHMALLDSPITTLTIDRQEHIWIGTWGSGLYEYDTNQTWIHHLVDSGLPSNYIHVVYAQPQVFVADMDRSSLIDRAIWVGTGPGDANSLGGIGRYRPGQKIWTSYDITHGLPPQQNDSVGENEDQNVSVEKTVDIYDILIDSRDGLVWAGTAEGLYIFSDETEGEERWSLHDLDLKDEVRSLLFVQDSLIVATATNLQRLISPTSNSQQSAIESPSISILPYRRNGQIEFSGGLRYDQPFDIGNQDIIAWYWESNLDGLFCTESLTCPLTHLGPGLHTIMLQRQNRYGDWLPAATTQLKVGHTIYLPICNK